MAHTWKYALGLGLMGAALSVGCTVTSGDDDAGTGGESASGGSGGTTSTGGTGGSTGGTGGSTGGTGGSTGGTTGGSAGAGTGGTTGGGAGAGTGGSSSGSGGSTSGSGGTGGVDTSPTCDSDKMGTPWQDCEPGDANKDDPCAICIKTSCCEESKNCYATDPYNVCGWGGPSLDDPMLADYAGAGEIGCITTCLSEYVTANEVCDSDGIDGCTSMCQTAMCSVIGSATNELYTCMQNHCSKTCFGADTCN